MINKNTFLIIILFISLYILKYDKVDISYIMILLTLITLFLFHKKETFVDYPTTITESIDTFKYGNINEKLLKQNRVYTSNSYHSNKDMYSLDYEDDRCHPLNIPTTFYKNK